MKAIVIEGYGGPDRLLLRERPDPGQALMRSSSGFVRRGSTRWTGRFAVVTCGWFSGSAFLISLAVTSQVRLWRSELA